MINLFDHEGIVQDKSHALDQGTFEVYDHDGKIICIVYRKNNIQLEKYPHSEILTAVSFKSVEDEYFLKKLKPKHKFDSITLSIKYKKIDDHKYTFVIRPAFLKIDYQITGSMIKLTDKIHDLPPIEYFKIHR